MGKGKLTEALRHGHVLVSEDGGAHLICNGFGGFSKSFVHTSSLLLVVIFPHGLKSIEFLREGFHRHDKERIGEIYVVRDTMCADDIAPNGSHGPFVALAL